MDIPNLSQNYQTPVTSPTTSIPIPKKNIKSNNMKFIVLIVLILGIVNGFWISRFFPTNKSSSNSDSKTGIFDTTISTENIKDKNQIEVGKTYGDSEKDFKDSATGTIVAGNINGEGTHILNREGGVSQRVSLMSSTTDLDLFVGRKVEVKGATNASTKTGWLLDVGSVKVLE